MITDRKVRYRRLIDRLLWLVVPEHLYRRLPDHCETCGGSRGGVRGNENIVDSAGKRTVMCDYCSADEHRYCPATSNDSRIVRTAKAGAQYVDGGATPILVEAGNGLGVSPGTRMPTVEADETEQMRYRVHLHSAPGMWTFYEGHVDVWVSSADAAFEAAVAKLGRTSFRDRASMSSWRLERVEPL